MISGIGTAIGGTPEQVLPLPEVLGRAVRGACSNAGVKSADIGYLVVDGSGDPKADLLEAAALSDHLTMGANHLPCWLGSVKADIGHAGGATGMAAVIKTILCLKQRLVPPVRQLVTLHSEWRTPSQRFQVAEAPQYWLTNRAAGPRRAMVTALGNDGSYSVVVIEEHHSTVPVPGVKRPLGDLAAGLFAVSANSLTGVGEKLAELKSLVSRHSNESSDQLAQRWYLCHPPAAATSLCLTLVVESPEELNAQISQVAKQLDRLSTDETLKLTDLLSPAQRERVFFSRERLAAKGKLAFIFPGSGNHFAGMGRDLAVRWPEVYAAQEAGSSYLADQYQPQRFWKGTLSDTVLEDHNALVISHVALCTALHDLLGKFAIRPQMVSGYSLGESSGLFSTGAWRERDAMLQRLNDSPLFTSDLAGDCHAARRIWGLPSGQQVDWCLGIVNASADQVRQVIAGKKRAYLLIINTYKECVIGGQRRQVEATVKELGSHFIPLHGVTTVHCEVTRAVADAYRNLHLFDVKMPRGIDFYSCAFGGKYPLTTTNAADAILAQALDTIDYPRVIERLYVDGARIFLEVGPGSSCSRMISSILGERPHLARSFCVPGQDATVQLLRLLGHCLAEGVHVDLTPLYPDSKSEVTTMSVKRSQIVTTSGGIAFTPSLPAPKQSPDRAVVPLIPTTDLILSATPTGEQSPAPIAGTSTSVDTALARLTTGFGDTLAAGASAHAAFLELAANLESSLAEQTSFQQQLLQQGEGSLFDDGQLSFYREPGYAPVDHDSLTDIPTAPTTPGNSRDMPAFDRAMCMEFAIGSVAKMLGNEFAEVDSFPTRVRLPDEPLMLVDRIVSLEGIPRSMTHGRVVTEHDVSADRWYLDGGRIPTCVAVEAGQADLFLAGYLGIDFITKGLAVYRLLDAVVTFHRGLPTVGQTIRYDIRIDRFFRQDQTYLIRFNYEATVNGEPLLSMRDGCAGFFTAEELAAGKGVVHTRLDLFPQPGRLPADWRELVPLTVESYSDAQVTALYAGDLAGCFGPAFGNLPLRNPYTLPGGKLKLVDRVILLDPEGGRYGIGQIRAEMDIQPDAWFLTCHFVDDRVMPGTLMYECCMHTLRIYLLRMGWIGESDTTWCEPVPGIHSGLKCRGQVTETTKKVTYQVNIKELGYGPEPYAIVDALMFADDHPIVEIPDMSVRLSGLDRDKVEALWQQRQAQSAKQQSKGVLYDRERITAFAIGNPSEAFGERYRVFDQERKIARLPGPPFQFLDRIIDVKGEPWQLVEGSTAVAQYDVPPDAWYFAAERQPHMPFSVLLEIGLQPCGWLAAYLGSALTSATDLSFRNLDGQAIQHRALTPSSGTLTIKVEITRIASSAGMIIQGYNFSVHDPVGVVYTGTTVFGFFSATALAQQVGVRGAASWQPPPEQLSCAKTFDYPNQAPFPDTLLRMVDTIDLFIADGGPQQLGFIRGSKIIDPDEWFFKAHFYQDPVCPGSLGLESFLQLLKVVAAERWGVCADSHFETMALGEEHRWNYRGQIIPTNQRVEIEAIITEVDDQSHTLKADGLLLVDGKIIYQMKQFALRFHK